MFMTTSWNVCYFYKELYFPRKQPAKSQSSISLLKEYKVPQYAQKKCDTLDEKKSFPQNAHSMNPRWRSSDPQPHLWLKILRSLLPSHLPLTQLKAHSLTLTHYCSLTCLLLTSDPLLLTRLSTHSLLPLTHSWHESCLSFLLTHNSLLPLTHI